MEDKIIFDLSIIANRKLKVIANGKLSSRKRLGKNYLWNYDMTKPMSSYLVALAIGRYGMDEMESESGVPMELYYEKKDESKKKFTYAHNKEIFDFVEQEIGVAYPWQNYKQVPVRDFLYAGMENTGCTLFSSQYMVDSIGFKDKNYINVNAHELAHQWFGNLVTERDAEHHWLHEGFATFYAYLAEESIYDSEYIYWKLYATAQQLHRFSEKNGGEVLRNPKASSLTFYEKGAWALFMLREQLGKDVFDKGIQHYLGAHKFQNVTIDDFISAMEEVGGADLTAFEENWLIAPLFPYNEAMLFLESKSTWIKKYNALRSDTSVKEKQVLADENWKMDVPYQFKAYLIESYMELIKPKKMAQLLDTQPYKVQQKILQVLPTIPKEAKESVEQLLEAESYLTIEYALLKLWLSFPDDRDVYLKRTADVVGFSDNNVRSLWLALALITEDMNESLRPIYFKALIELTANSQPYEARQLAFNYLNQLNGFESISITNLIDASGHHVWRFRTFAREMLKKVLETEQGAAILSDLENKLNQNQLKILEKVKNL